MRIALVALVLAFAGCAKKQPPAQAPAPMIENKPADSAVPGEAGAPAPDDAKNDQGTVKGDPCDGGEVKKK